MNNTAKRTQRIPLEDMSFLIPTRIDSQDRLDNVMAVANYLDKFFDTNILILEADITPKISDSQLPSSCKVIFIEDDNPLFNHTRYNNYLAMHADSTLIAVYDTDIVLPIMQILKAVNLLRSGQADFVSPYDGRFLMVDPLFKNLFTEVLEPDLLELNRGKFHMIRTDSWGGASFIKKSSYIEAGMSNEYFESWGPEDGEIPVRFDILGYIVKRIDGSIFHLSHRRGINSAYANDSLKVKYRKEYRKICSMKKEELRAYVETWAWIAKWHPSH